VSHAAPADAATTPASSAPRRHGDRRPVGRAQRERHGVADGQRARELHEHEVQPARPHLQAAARRHLQRGQHAHVRHAVVLRRLVRLHRARHRRRQADDADRERADVVERQVGRTRGALARRARPGVARGELGAGVLHRAPPHRVGRDRVERRRSGSGTGRRALRRGRRRDGKRARDECGVEGVGAWQGTAHENG
jgi:hypothetical protein